MWQTLRAQASFSSSRNYTTFFHLLIFWTRLCYLFKNPTNWDAEFTHTGGTPPPGLGRLPRHQRLQPQTDGGSPSSGKAQT